MDNRMKHLLLILFVCLIGTGQGWAQGTINVKGQVLDESQIPVIGASVLVKGTQKGQITDIDGNFYFEGLKKSDVLVISYVGMKKQEVGVKPVMKVVLQADSELLDEVLVVAFGEQKKSSFTGSAAVVDSKKLESRQVNNVMGALEGNVAGLQAFSASGSPDASPTFRIRGISSINAGKDPLIVLDGVPYDGDWNSINPSDVASITVLKDAASNALYGARGANGVIIITTKKGAQGKATVQLDAKWGVSSRALQRYETIDDPREYIETYYQSLYNYYTNGRGMSASAAHSTANATLFKSSAEGGLGYLPFTVPNGEYLIGTNGRLNPNTTIGNRVYNNGKVYTIMPDNWIDEAYRNSLRQEYNLSLTAGGDRSQFYASFGFLDADGIVVNNNFRRYTARLKASYKAFDWLNVGGNVNFTRSISNSADEDATGGTNIFSQVANMAPIYPVYIRDGEGNIYCDENGPVGDYGDGLTLGANYVRPYLKQSNGITDARLNYYNTIQTDVNLNGFLDIDIIDGLKATLNGSVYTNGYNSTYTQNPFYGFGNASYPGGYVGKTQYNYYAVNFQELLKYNKSFGKHNISVLAGHENYTHDYNYITGSRKNMFSYFGNHELSGATTMIDNGSYSSKYKTEGWIFRALYDWNSKYFAQVSYRRDASSRFHPDHRWGNFYSFGGAWLISKENFMQDVKWINHLKLKASFGQNGNDNISDFLYTDTYSISKGEGNDVSLTLSHIGNPDITWETVTNINAGLEFELFKSRIRGSVEYFYRKTTDMLCTVRVPLSAGYAGFSSNVGDMVNKGVEMELEGDIIKNKLLTWTMGMNMTHYTNEITRLNEDNRYNTLNGHPGYTSGSYYYGEGLPMYTWRLKKYAGVNENGESMWYMHDANGNLVTTTNPTEITKDEDYFDCGTSIPDLYGGFNTSLKAFGFDLNVSFAYQIGGKVMDWSYASLMSPPTPGSTGVAIHRDVLNSWSAENTGSNIPRWQYNDIYSTSTSDRFLTDGSWLSLQNISLGYTLPKKWLAPLHVSSLRVYASGENLALWSKRRGLDPRTSTSGSMSAALYAPAKTITGGITIQF